MEKTSLLLLAIVAMTLTASAQSWTQKADYPVSGSISDNRCYFSVGNGIYVLDELDRTLWMYDPVADNWIQKSNFPGVQRFYGFTMSIGIRVYYGSGDDISGTYRNDFWEYDPIADTWSPLDTLPVRYSGATAFTIGNKGYLMMGMTNMVNVSNELWEYYPATDTWTPKNNIGFPLRYACSGVSDGFNGYLGFGYSSLTHMWYDDLYLYDAFSDSWSTLDPFPFGARCYAMATATGQYIYTGFGNMSMTAYSDVYQADLATGTWTSLPALPGSGRTSPLGFLVNGKLYAGLGHHLPSASPANDLWALTVASGLPESDGSAPYYWYASSTDEVTLVFRQLLPDRISIYDITGKLIIEKNNITTPEHRFALPNHGVFMVKYESGDTVSAFKIVR